MRRDCWLLVLGLVWPTSQLGDGRVTTAQAQGGAVAAVFEKHNLMGTFAWDCGKPASPDNWYFVNRPNGANHVQRDFMVGPTTRQWVAIIDTAAETGRNQITISGRLTGQVAGKSHDNQLTIGTWRMEGDRMQTWEGSLAGEKTIGAGKLLATGKDIPWLNRCGAQ